MDQALKQRLVGATVLIILGVILIPMLLSGQPELQNESRRIELPDKPPELSMETRRFPIGGQTPGRPSQVPEPGVEQEPEATSADGSAEPAEKPEETPAEASSSSEAEAVVEEQPRSEPSQVAVAPVTQPLAADISGRYLVQVASFSNSSNANQLADILNRNQLPVLMDTVVTGAGRLHRVRVGPFDELAGATASRDRIQGLLSDLNPRVVDLRPDENAPVTDPSDPLVRWAVQAGVFSEQDNAGHLVGELRQAGFTAYSEEVSSASGTVYKVKIGPVLERQSAIELVAELSRKMKIDGMVMSVD